MFFILCSPFQPYLKHFFYTALFFVNALFVFCIVIYSKFNTFLGNCYGWGCGQTLAYWLEVSLTLCKPFIPPSYCSLQPWTCCLAGISLGLCGLVDPYTWYLTHRLRTVLALMD